MKSLIAYFSMQIKSLAVKLGRAPTLLYLFGYLITIIVFSLIYYYALPGKHFYHSTSQFEDEFFNSDAKDILQGIRSEMIKTFLENGEATQEELMGGNLTLTSLIYIRCRLTIFRTSSVFELEYHLPLQPRGEIIPWLPLLLKLFYFLMTQ